MAEGKLVGAVSSAIAVLRHLSDGKSARNGDIAKALGLNPSTCFNILKTLAGENLVTFEPRQKTYSVGLGLVDLASGALVQSGYIEAVRPELEELAKRWRVTATLWLRVSRNRVILIDRADSGAVIEVRMKIGQRLPVVVGALGRCIAGYSTLERAELEEMYDGLRSDNPIGFDLFLEQAAEARNKGYAIDKGNFVSGVTTIASPILGAMGEPILVISAVGFTAQFERNAGPELGRYLQSMTRRISQALNRRISRDGDGRAPRDSDAEPELRA